MAQTALDKAEQELTDELNDICSLGIAMRIAKVIRRMIVLSLDAAEGIKALRHINDEPDDSERT